MEGGHTHDVSVLPIVALSLKPVLNKNFNEYSTGTPISNAHRYCQSILRKVRLSGDDQLTYFSHFVDIHST